MTTDTQDIRMPVAEMTLPDGRKVNTSPKFDIGRQVRHRAQLLQQAVECVALRHDEHGRR